MHGLYRNDRKNKENGLGRFESPSPRLTLSQENFDCIMSMHWKLAAVDEKGKKGRESRDMSRIMALQGHHLFVDRRRLWKYFLDPEQTSKHLDVLPLALPLLALTCIMDWRPKMSSRRDG
jgi:hypothetical protein